MTIGLIGSSESGKTTLAHGLAEKLGHLNIVDGYIEEFQTQTDLAVAKYASTYVVNMQIAMFRLGKELQQKKLGRDYITCGTLLDTSIYTALHAAEYQENSDGTYEMKVLEDKRVFATMYWFAMFKQDTWHYDHVFYLPPNTDDAVARVFDQSIDDALSTFQIDAVKLEGTDEEKLQTALKEIDEAPDGPTA